MLSRRRFTAATAAALAAAPFVRTARAQSKIVIRYGDVLAANYPSVVALEAAGKEIAEKTGGRIEMQTFPASQLGTQRDMIDALGGNALQLYTDGAATFGSWVPAITASKAVKEPRDMEGFKLRVPPVDVFNAMAEAWGARPTPINFGELYLSLKQGVVDGQENPLPTIQSAKLFEVQKYLVLTAHIITPRFVVVNEQFWRGLPDADRAIVQASISKAVVAANAEILKQESELADTFKKGGMTVITPDVAAFRAAVLKSVPPKFESRWGKGVYERLQSL
jgi:TRAP-type C4-dicarboxylate transport system substrate-binding protein